MSSRPPRRPAPPRLRPRRPRPASLPEFPGLVTGSSRWWSWSSWSRTSRSMPLPPPSPAPRHSRLLCRSPRSRRHPRGAGPGRRGRGPAVLWSTSGRRTLTTASSRLPVVARSNGCRRSRPAYGSAQAANIADRKPRSSAGRALPGENYSCVVHSHSANCLITARI